jgi:hypothetical protein
MLKSRILPCLDVKDGRVVKGVDILTPKAVVQPTPVLQGDALNMVQAKLDRWLADHVAEVLAPLFALREAANGAKDEEGNDIIFAVGESELVIVAV